MTSNIFDNKNGISERNYFGRGMSRIYIFEKINKHGRVDKRAVRLINQFIADPRVKYSLEECDHLCRVMNGLISADDTSDEIKAGALFILRYCIPGASQETKDEIMANLVLYDTQLFG